VTDNARRTRQQPEYELLDTGVFDDNRYWEITADYAKATPEDLLLRITVRNAGPELATLDVLPTLWFRNTWSWYHRRGCGRCAHCVAGNVMLCPNGQRAHGFGCDGADADYMVTDARCLLPLPSHFSNEEGVVLACNAGTA